MYTFLCNAQQKPAALCDTLRRTATHCNTLQHKQKNLVFLRQQYTKQKRPVSSRAHRIPYLDRSFPQKSPIISGSFAKNDHQKKLVFLRQQCTKQKRPVSSLGLLDVFQQPTITANQKKSTIHVPKHI